MKKIFASWSKKFRRLSDLKALAGLLRLSISLSLTLLLLSCATAPTKFDSVRKGRWQSKLLVKNLKEGKSQIVNAEVIAIRPDRMRLEVTTALGIHVASLVLNQNQVRVLLPRDKKFLIGPATPASMKAAIGIDFDPILFMSVLFDEDLGQGWSCSRDKKGFIEKCESVTRDMLVIWGDREVARRRVDIQGKTFALQFMLQGFSTKVEETPELFSLEAPEGFQTQSIGYQKRNKGPARPSQSRAYDKRKSASF